MSDWCIKLPGHIKPIIEEQARAELYARSRLRPSARTTLRL